MYTNKFSPIVKGVTELDCSSTSNLDVFGVFANMRVTRLMALVSTVMNSTGPVVLNFYRRPTHGSATGEVLIGSISISGTAAVGKCYFKDVAGVQVHPGEEVVCKVGTAATTSGKVLSGLEANEEAEVPANISNMVAG